ncbi:hypothetical protein PDL71_08545 [Lacibacter sp. MH-610]|uniref:tetratricopeptide repeat protein n=1 Tax=Lacibacter sp. MH-610 TaxID=3020883 RepID=UPI0038927191
MKFYSSLFFVFLLLACSNTFAQNKPKPVKPQEKPPTQKEMDDMMKEMDNILKNMTPEQKRMYDSIGIKLPNKKNMQGVTDKHLADAWEDENRVVPARKTALINTLPKTIFSKEQLASFIKKTNLSIPSVIKPEARQMADKIIEQFKNDPYYGYMIASAANGMWMMGYKESATYLMGKAAEAIPNADHLNNFASYLTMGGAAHIAIPILEKLNSVHKNNSTILNNLGQAWLQLGDEQKGEKYLDSAIRVYTYHPQANYTKCLLLKARGKKGESIAALHRSLKHSITTPKTNLLKELEANEYKPVRFYAPRVYYSTTFNLHEYAAMVPKTYATALGSNIELQWRAFREYIKTEKEKITRQIELASKNVSAGEQAFYKKAQAARFNIHSPYHSKAVERYNSYTKDFDRRLKQYTENLALVIKQKTELTIKFNTALEKERNRFDEEIRNGANKQANCEGQLPIINEFLEKTNQLNRKFNELSVSFWLTEFYNIYYYYPSTANTDATAQLIVLNLRIGFLDKLYELFHESDLGYPCTSDLKKKQEYSILKPLNDFDEVNCKIFNWIYTPGLGTIVMRCNTMSVHLNPILIPFDASLRANFDGFVEQASVGIEVKGVKIKVGAEFDEKGNFEKGNGSIGTEIKGIDVNMEAEIDEKGFKKGSVELGIDKELSLLPKTLEEEAPVEIGLKNELGASMELTRSEDGIIADFIVKEKSELDIASKMEVDNKVEMTPGMISKSGKVTEPETVKLSLPAAPSVKVSADSRWSVNSGYSAKGESSFSKLK